MQVPNAVIVVSKQDHLKMRSHRHTPGKIGYSSFRGPKIVNHFEYVWKRRGVDVEEGESQPTPYG